MGCIAFKLLSKKLCFAFYSKRKIKNLEKVRGNKLTKEVTRLPLLLLEVIASNLEYFLSGQRKWRSTQPPVTSNLFRSRLIKTSRLLFYSVLLKDPIIMSLGMKGPPPPSLLSQIPGWRSTSYEICPLYKSNVCFWEFYQYYSGGGGLLGMNFLLRKFCIGIKVSGVIFFTWIIIKNKLYPIVT